MKYEILMKVLRGQETSLESSKGFHKGSRLTLTDISTHAPKSMKSMKIHENLSKSMKSITICKNI